MSKGSKQRPTDKQKFDENYDRIFGKKKQADGCCHKTVITPCSDCPYKKPVDKQEKS